MSMMVSLLWMYLVLCVFVRIILREGIIDCGLCSFLTSDGDSGADEALKKDLPSLLNSRIVVDAS